MTTKNRKRNLAKIFEDITVHNKKPPKDESIWLDNPKMAFIYAKYIRKTRWPELQEFCFYKNIQALYSYVLWIVDTGQSVPEHLHNFMLAKSLESLEEDKEWIDLYFKNIKKVVVIK
jgi:hypothetical protein